MSHLRKRLLAAGFSLVEILLVVVIIAVLSAIVIPQISQMRGSASASVARQQQAELQTALGNWIVARASGPGGLAAARNAYNGHSGNKLTLLQNYLQSATYSSLAINGNDVTSGALSAANATLRFSAWNAGGQQPIVEWINQ